MKLLILLGTFGALRVKDFSVSQNFNIACKFPIWARPLWLTLHFDFFYKLLSSISFLNLYISCGNCSEISYYSSSFRNCSKYQFFHFVVIEMPTSSSMYLHYTHTAYNMV